MDSDGDTVPWLFL